ncbi:MAG: poly-beta-1,6-N-acetyl-D-glucosamine N-deacetylase PgaB [Acidobacteriaceae bacterium]
MKAVALAGVLFLVGLSAWGQSSNVVVLCYHDVRDDVGGAPIPAVGSAEPSLEISAGGSRQLDPDQYAISTRNLASHFDWLRAHGYHVISLQQLIDARTKGEQLPDKPVLLTFDDGLQSAYTKVFPLLKAYQYHAVMAVVGAWTDLPAGGTVDYGFRLFTRADFATWPELREMQNSGLVEIASHTWDLHHGIVANPQGNVIPAVLVHAYNAKTGRYETDQEYAARIRADLTRSAEEIRAQLGRAPRGVMWPYGAYTREASSIAASLGMPVTFTLGLPVTFPNRPFGVTGLAAIPRLVMTKNPTVGDLVWSLHHLDMRGNVRAVQVDLDYVYDPNPLQQERNLGRLLDRIRKIGATQVWLQAFADPDGTGAPSELYFPNHELPMRADLFSRVAWQLRTRCGVEVYAWMPVLAWQLPDKSLQARLEIRPRPGVSAESPVRLNPYLPETREIVGEIYADLGRAAPVAGILFSDDSILRDTDELGPSAPPPGPQRTQSVIAFTDELAARVRTWSPELATARNLFAEPVLNPDAETWYAQSLPAFLSSYNTVALMAMPELENVKKPDDWLNRLYRRVAAQQDGIRDTVFELQSVDWRTKKPIATDVFDKEMLLLQDKGVLNLGYYPDDFEKNNPKLNNLVPVFSGAAYPAP